MTTQKLALVGGHWLLATFGTFGCHCGLQAITKLISLQDMEIVLVIFYIVVVLFSVILHEVSHGLMAYSMGDATAKYAGRLTLNPLKHLDIFGSILLPLLTFFTAGFIFGYAKPVPYNPLNLNDQTYGPAKVAIAGPLSNILLAVIFGLSVRFFGDNMVNELEVLFRNIVRLNIGLAVFNLVPIPPLDGHWILLTFLPSRFRELRDFITRYGIFLFVIFVFFLFEYLMPLINFLFKVIVGT